MARHKITRAAARGLLIGLAGIAIFAAGYWIRGSGTREAAPSVVQAPEATVTYTCAMHPSIRKNKPGTCPICAMDLVPVADEGGGAMAGLREFRTSEAAKQRMNIEVAEVERRFVTKEIRMAGKVDFDETRLGDITAWIPGRLDRLYVDYTGVEVKKGDHMVYLYSPDLLIAQEELRRAAKAIADFRPNTPRILKETAEGTRQASREKLRRWGLTEGQINKAERQGISSDHVTVYAPMSGTVIHRNGQEGMYVDEGTRIYTIADLSTLWVKLDAYESDLPWLHYGQAVSFSTEAYPGETFEGRISFIDPVLDRMTRTVKVRVVVPNPDGKLKPEMFVRSVVRAQVATGGRVMDPNLAGKWISPMHPEVIKDEPGSCDVCGMPLVKAENLGYVPAAVKAEDMPLVVPVSAPLQTGTRAIVYVEVPGAGAPTYQGREIILGPRAGDYYIVRSGLREGDRVVTRGNFKIDSALQIQAKPSMMTPGGGGGGGHDHGGGGAKAADEDAAAKVDLSSVSQEQLQALIDAHAPLPESIESGNRVQAKEMLGRIEEALKAVDGSLLSGHTHMVWMEYAMRLQNDLVEARDAKTDEALKAAAGVLAGNMAEMRSKLGLTGHSGQEAATQRYDAPEAFQQQLAGLYAAYVGVVDALASDAFENARKAAVSGATTLDAIDMKLLQGDAHKTWMAMVEPLGMALDAMAKADAIETVRAETPALTEALTKAIEAFGLPPGKPAYKAYCPMAFDGKGGNWLQPDSKIRNPYYGSMMLGCGEIKGRLDSTSPSFGHAGHAPPPSDHEGSHGKGSSHE